MDTEGTLHSLTGGLRVKPRFQHPSVHEAIKNRQAGWWWFFRYYADEIGKKGSALSVRKRQWIGPSRGEKKISKKAAELERDRFLSKLNATTVDEAVQRAAAMGVALFGEVARMYEKGYLSRENQIAGPTREKETLYLENYILPQWGEMRLNQMRPQAIEDWLHQNFNSWHTMHGVRAIMSRIFYYAEGHGLWEEGRRSPASRAKLGKKRYVYERRILTFDETARMLEHLQDPNRLVVETCIATGARISEVLGLQWKHVNLDAATIKIEQRVWHQEISRTKTESSRRTLGIGNLATRFREKAVAERAKPESFVFHQKSAPDRPLWDSSVRLALHEAAKAAGCDFPGLGLHAFRRANITWRQEVGGSAIEASKIAGHANLEMTSEYTFVAPERQNELTRRIQEKLANAGAKAEKTAAEPAPHGPATPEVPPNLAELQPSTEAIQ